MSEAPTLLDNRATPCAVGLIRAATAMRTLPPGARLEVWSRDRFAPMEVPLWAERDGHTVLVHERAGSWPRRFWRFVVQGAGSVTDPAPTAPGQGTTTH